MTVYRTAKLALGAAVLALGLAACGGSLTLADIESELADKIPEETAAVGVEVSDVDCPDDASVEPGATFDCDVPAVENGQDVVYTATVTVESEDTIAWELTSVRPA